jgi:signal peptidase II
MSKDEDAEPRSEVSADEETAKTDPPARRADEPKSPASATPAATPGVPMQIRFALLGITAVLVIALDLWTKQWVWDNLRGKESIVLIDPWLELNFAFNTGTAFSIVREIDQPVLFLLIALGVLGYVVYVTLRSSEAGKLSFLALGGIVGGAAGNLHDRFVRIDHLGRHGVVDFIQINYPWGGSWPNFNVADSALVVGVGLLLVTSFFEKRTTDIADKGPKKKKKKKKPAAAPA